MSPKPSDRTLLLFLMTPILVANIYCGAHIFLLVKEQSAIKEDYAEVNNIRNGLLSVNVWKTNLENIATENLANFKVNPEKEEAAKHAVEKAVNVMISEMGVMMQKPQKTFGGKMRKMAFKVFVDTKTLEAQSPQYAQAVIDEVKKPENLEKIKNLALSEVEESKDTDGNEASSLAPLLSKYNAHTVDEFNQHAEGIIRASQHEALKYSCTIIGSVLLFLAVWWGIREKSHLHRAFYTLSDALGFIVLLSALALPMIDIDARIKNIDFLLMGEHMQFTNQVLFFRSKSIMQMVKILLTEGQAQTVVVGFLIFLFSIIFPITKLLSSLIYLYAGEKLRNHKWVHFFAFDSGKWSMADVMVVAIFMAYIGFNGVLNGQLKNLSANAQSFGVIATNQTALQPGFTLFLTFTLYALLLSEILKRIRTSNSQP